MDGELNQEQELQVTLIRRRPTTLTDLVNDLLDLARIEAGKTVVRLAIVHRRRTSSAPCAACSGPS